MSANRTDLDEETKRHRGPLRGMFAVVLFALVMLAILAFWAFGRGGDPSGDGQAQGAEAEAVNSGSNDAITANDRSSEEAGATGGTTEADPSAVTVPAETVTAPDVGAGTPPDTDPGESQAAEPLNPVDDDAGSGDAGTEGN